MRLHPHLPTNKENNELCKLIQLLQIGKSFRTAQGSFQALNGIDLRIDRGEIFGIIGRSGAGKSTLLRMINLLERPDKGSIVVDGEDIPAFQADQLRAYRQRVGMVFQHFNLLHSKTVEENVRFSLRIAGVLNAQEQQRRVEEVLNLVGIAEQAKKYPARLSGGQRQRVGIARALANRPDVLLCDEATSALDPLTTREILDLLLEINRRLHLTIVLITHSMEVIRAVADRIAVLNRGEVVEFGSVADVLLHPQHAITRGLLSENGIEYIDALSLAQPNEANGHVLRLTYTGSSAISTSISRLSREAGVDFSFLEGSVGRLKAVHYGQFTVQLESISEERFANLLAAAGAAGVVCQILR